MCEKCDELQYQVEFKQRSHERAWSMMDGFQPMGPSASHEETEYRKAAQRNADHAYAELQKARQALAHHKAAHTLSSQQI